MLLLTLHKIPSDFSGCHNLILILVTATPGDGDGSQQGNCPMSSHSCFNGGTCAVCITGDIGSNSENGCLLSRGFSHACDSGTTCSPCSEFILI